MASMAKPKEWFSVPIEIIHQSIKLLSENRLKDFFMIVKMKKL